MAASGARALVLTGLLVSASVFILVDGDERAKAHLPDVRPHLGYSVGTLDAAPLVRQATHGGVVDLPLGTPPLRAHLEETDMPGQWRGHLLDAQGQPRLDTHVTFRHENGALTLVVNAPEGRHEIRPMWTPLLDGPRLHLFRHEPT